MVVRFRVNAKYSNREIQGTQVSFVAKETGSERIRYISHYLGNAVEPLNFTSEFNHLLSYIQITWTIPCLNTFESAAKDAFNKGLHDGRFWIDTHLPYRVGRVINSSETEICPIEKRLKLLGPESIYDALCVFDSYFKARLSDVYQSQLRWGKWNYSNNTQALLAKLKSTYCLEGLAPIMLPNDQQMALAINYPGFKAEGIRCHSTPARLMYCDVIYSLEEQGRSFVHTLFSAIYSHGLACAQEYNDQTLSEVLTSIYCGFRDLPFDVNNSEQIMTLARGHELMSLFEAIEPIDFITSDEYTSLCDKKAKHNADWNKLTAEEQEAAKILQLKNAEEQISSILKEIKQEEHLSKEQEKLQMLDALIEKFRAKLTVFSL